MIQHCLEEGEVCRDAANAILAQSAIHPRDDLLRGRRPRGNLLQQRIIVARHDGAGISRAAVDADAEPERAAIGGDPPIIGNNFWF